MALCWEPFGEEIARAAQFIEAEEAAPGTLDEITAGWHKASSDVHRFGRENPEAALGIGLAAGLLIGIAIGSR